MSQSLELFFSNFPEETAPLARLQRKIILGVFPEAEESLDTQNLGFGFGTGYSQLIFVISPHKSHVIPGFARGASSPGPAGLMEGKGKVHRHVKIRSAAQLERPELQGLMTEARQRTRARPPIPARGRRRRLPVAGIPPGSLVDGNPFGSAVPLQNAWKESGLQIGFRPPSHVVQNIIDLHGERGRQWLDGLPDLLQVVSRRWQLTLQPPYAFAAYCFVAPGVLSDGQEVVIKIGYPEPGLDREAEALRHFGRRGAVQLLDADRDTGALLLERCRPGTQLSEGLSEGEAVSAAALVMAQLHQKPQPGHPFSSIADWGGGFQRLRQRFGGSPGPLPEPIFCRAERIYAEMSQSGPSEVVLHGDLHHGNILAAGRQPWLAIDPKGVVGPPEYEVGAFLRNPMPRILENSDLSKVLARRVDSFSELLSVRRERLIAWGGAQAVLAACWAVEDHSRGWEPWFALAQALLDRE